MNKILDVKNVSKYFGKLKAVDNICFNVTENEIFGIAGPNGAGKSTLFNIITGIPFHADYGKIIFNGKSIESLAPSKICHIGLARTFQKEAVFQSLTVKENVIIGASYGQGVTDIDGGKNKVSDVLNFTGIAKTEFDKKAKDITLFNKKKLMIASALVTNPKMLMLDEPVAGLNNIEIKETINLLKKINKMKITIIVIEHVLSFLIEISNSIMILSAGKKLIKDLPEKVINDERVVRTYLGGN